MTSNPLPDGVYVNLPDADYFAQDRLGSTDLSVLHSRPADWFYGSRHNPHRPERESTDEMDFGSALHLLLLEGDEAYAARTMLRPEVYPVVVKGIETGEFKPWNGNANWCKDWLEFNERPDRLILTEDADRRVRHMAELIRNHPELGPPMMAGLSEVAVFWTNADGIKLRAKFDKLLPRFVVDLKTFGGDAKGRTVKEQCMGLVAQRSMDVQRFLYFQGRQKMAELPVFGADADQAEWLRKVAAVEAWQWCWIFYRRRDDKRGFAPIVKPIIRSHFDASFETGRRKVEVALTNYKTFRDRFGFDVPWAVVEPAEEPADHEFPSWLADVAEPVTFPEPHKEAA